MVSGWGRESLTQSHKSHSETTPSRASWQEAPSIVGGGVLISPLLPVKDQFASILTFPEALPLSRQSLF